MLSANSIGDGGATAFLAALPDTQVERLDLCGGFSVAKGRILDGTKASLRVLQNANGTPIQFE